MTFRNELERKSFEVARRVLGEGVTLEHNRTIQIESALFPEVASFKGPPAKEIDVLVGELLDAPRLVLLVSCKLLSRRAEPAHVQEWCAVVQTMNRYADGTTYFGLVLSPSGFTSGCEAWATSHNLGILPPLKGRNLVFGEETVMRMFERVLVALRARVRMQDDDLRTAPSFFDFVYRMVADFEGHREAVLDGRYVLSPKGWVGSFGEMYAAIAGLTVEDLLCLHGATVLKLSGAVSVRFNGVRVEFGRDPALTQGPEATPRCVKNLEMDPCTLEFLRSVVVGKTISSAGDFGAYLEVGIEQRFNLGLHPAGFHIISTEVPVDEHRV
jgi:hypothetical protein